MTATSFTSGPIDEEARLLRADARERRLCVIGRIFRVALVGWGIAVLAATGLVLARRPVPVSPRLDVAPPAPGDRLNLALQRYGARVRASSYDPFAQHHPVFAIDGRRTGPLLEKWASAGRDRAPWLEVLLPRPARVDEVVIVHAGHVEDSAYTMARYSVRCLRSGEVAGRVDVNGNAEPIARHPLPCDRADAIRIDFAVGDRSGPRGVARIYEVEVLGEVLP